MVFCFVILTFVKLMAHSWGSLWPSSGKVWQGYGKTIFKLWLSYGNVLEKIWQSLWQGAVNLWQSDGDICSHVISKFWPSCVKNMAKV